MTMGLDGPGVCYFDVAKCFDYISHDVLYFKLRKFCICGIEDKWFYSYLNCRTQATLCNNILSDFYFSEIWRPTGLHSRTPWDCLVFADDTMVQHPGTTFRDVNVVIADDTENLSSCFID